MKAIKRLVTVLIMTGAVTAIAQPDPVAPADPNAGGAGSGSAAAPANPTPPPPARIQYTASEMKTRAELILAKIQEDYRYVSMLREKVKKTKDVIKLNCVNDRLVQLKAQMNIADRTSTTIQSAVEKDPAGANDQLTSLEGTGNSVRELREQANQCVGEPELYKQEAGLEITRPDLVDDPGVIDPYLPDGVVVEPPGYASAFQ